MIHTACYRGFYAKYRLTEVLYLSELTINEKIITIYQSTELNHRKSSTRDDLSKLNLHIPFTGKIRQKFLNEYYVHMGFRVLGLMKQCF